MSTCVKTLIKTSLLISEQVLFTYLNDFLDNELYMQPALKSNSIGWQLGHLIISESEVVKLLSGHKIDLPSGLQRDKFREVLYDDGLIILACGNQSIRFRPHLNVTKEEIQIALDKIENNISKI